MDVLRSIRNNLGGQEMTEKAYTKSALVGESRPQTLTEMLDSQISFYEKKISDLKEAKNAISPDVERALNALAKL